MNIRKRNVSIDVIKGMGIFLMVSGHCGAPCTHFIYLFHMAIFFIASGYLFNEKHSNNFQAFINFAKRKFKSLWFPYVLWIAIFTILNNFFIKINIYTDNKRLLDYASGEFIKTMPYLSFEDILKNIFKGLLLHGGSQIGSAMWFLATLFEISVLYCLIDLLLKFKLNKNKALIVQAAVSVIFLLIGYSLSATGKSLAGYARVFSCYILFYLGHIFKLFNISNIGNSMKKHVFTFLICMAILLYMDRLGSIDLGANSYGNPLYLLIVSCVGWQFLYEMAEIIKQREKVKDFWVKIGQNTLAVIILHFLCFKIVNVVEVIIYRKPSFLIAAFPTLYTNNGWWIIYIFVGLFIPVALSILKKKSIIYCQSKFD